MTILQKNLQKERFFRKMADGTAFLMMSPQPRGAASSAHLGTLQALKLYKAKYIGA